MADLIYHKNKLLRLTKKVSAALSSLEHICIEELHDIANAHVYQRNGTIHQSVSACILSI